MPIHPYVTPPGPPTSLMMAKLSSYLTIPKNYSKQLDKMINQLQVKELMESVEALHYLADKKEIDKRDRLYLLGKFEAELIKRLPLSFNDPSFANEETDKILRCVFQLSEKNIIRWIVNQGKNINLLRDRLQLVINNNGKRDFRDPRKWTPGDEENMNELLRLVQAQLNSEVTSNDAHRRKRSKSRSRVKAPLKRSMYAEIAEELSAQHIASDLTSDAVEAQVMTPVRAPHIQVIKRKQDQFGNEVGEVYTAGDVHGAANSLALLINNRLMEPGKENNILILAGDLTDRGKNSVKVIEDIVAYQAKYPGRLFAVQGNHEDMCLKNIKGMLHFFDELQSLILKTNNLTVDSLYQEFISMLRLIRDEEDENFANVILHHIHEGNGGDWLVRLFIEEVVEGKIMLSNDQDKLFQYSDSKIEVIQNFMQSLPYIVHVDCENNGVGPGNTCHADMPISDDELARRIQNNSPYLSDEEIEYALLARPRGIDADVTIEDRGRGPNANLTTVGHNIVNGNNILVVRPETSTINVDIGAFFRGCIFYTSLTSDDCGFDGEAVVLENNHRIGSDGREYPDYFFLKTMQNKEVILVEDKFLSGLLQQYRDFRLDYVQRKQLSQKLDKTGQVSHLGVFGRLHDNKPELAVAASAAEVSAESAVDVGRSEVEIKRFFINILARADWLGDQFENYLDLKENSADQHKLADIFSKIAASLSGCNVSMQNNKVTLDAYVITLKVMEDQIQEFTSLAARNPDLTFVTDPALFDGVPITSMVQVISDLSSDIDDALDRINCFQVSQRSFRY